MILLKTSPASTKNLSEFALKVMRLLLQFPQTPTSSYFLFLSAVMNELMLSGLSHMGFI